MSQPCNNLLLRNKIPQLIRERKHEVLPQHLRANVFNIYFLHIPAYTLILPEQVEYGNSEFTIIVLQKLLSYADIPQPEILIKTIGKTVIALVIQIILKYPTIFR
jgi:hypothetical protein